MPAKCYFTGIVSVNMFVEKIFIILWFWYLLLLLFTVWSLISWAWEVFPRCNRLRFVKKFLKLGYYKLNTKKEKRRNRLSEIMLLHNFLDDHLKIDGAFILYFIELKAGEITAAKVTANIWKIWKSEISII